MALTTGLFVFGKIGAQEHHVTASFIRDLSLEMPADEKTCSGLMLAGGNSRKLEAFCEKPLLPRSTSREQRALLFDCRRNIARNLALCVSVM